MAFQCTDWCKKKKRKEKIPEDAHSKNQDKHLGWACTSESHPCQWHREQPVGFGDTAVWCAKAWWAPSSSLPSLTPTLAAVPHTDQLENKLWQSTDIHLPLGKQVRTEIKLIARTVWRLQPTRPVAVKLRIHLYGSVRLSIWETKEQFILPIKTSLLHSKGGVISH